MQWLFNGVQEHMFKKSTKFTHESTSFKWQNQFINTGKLIKTK